MSPASERSFPTKKSLRIWVRNNGHVQRKKRFTYVYPRTVEAAKDPFICSSGKNKMFFLIAINLYPESKIVKPDESDSESESVDTEVGVDDGNSSQSQSTIPSNSSSDLKNKLVKRNRKVRNCPSPDILEAPGFKNSVQIASPAADSDSTDENLSQDDLILAASSKTRISGKRKGLKRKWVNCKSRNLKRLKNNDENKSASSIWRKGLSKSAIPARSKANGSNNVAIKRSPPMNTRKVPPPTDIPNIVNSLQKIIQTCSDTGVISFNLPKVPRRS